MPSLAAFRWTNIEFRPAWLHEMRRVVGWWLLTLLACIAVLLLSRRLSGALALPLSIGALLLTGVGLAVLARVCRIALGKTAAAIDGIVPLVALALTLPGSSPWGVALLWLVPVGEAISARRYVRRPESTHSVTVPSGLPTSRANDNHVEDAGLETITSVRGDSDQTQRLVYATDETGAMTVHGWLRVPLFAGQRVAVTHSAFCPAFAAAPQAEAEPTAGPDCTIRPTQLLPWGIRWEIKLAAAATGDEAVQFEFFAAVGEQ